MNKNCHKIDRKAIDKEKFQKSRFEHKDKIAKYFTAYMDMYDEIIAYYNQKYFKERSKNWNKINGRSNKIRLSNR